MAIDWQALRNALKRRRTRAGLTQAELAKRVDVAWGTIARIEIGDRRPSLDLLEQIADVLGCRVRDLLPEKETRR
jgi:transcriptional regulator with XRE-family HTH domain